MQRAVGHGERVRVYRGFWMTDDDAARMGDGDGYVYRLA
jgi:hypothetical protein